MQVVLQTYFEYTLFLIQMFSIYFTVIKTICFSYLLALEFKYIIATETKATLHAEKSFLYFIFSFYLVILFHDQAYNSCSLL